jgi:hypothetical protein
MQKIEMFETTDMFRRRMVELARSVATTGTTVELGTRAGRPRYILRPATPVDASRCVQLGPDELRRHFTEIRALIRLEDFAFGIRVGGELLAVVCRHPGYRPTAAEHYRSVAARLRGEDPTSSDLETRLKLLEIAVTALADRQAVLEVAWKSVPPSKPDCPDAATS